jgi:hypothetical protein
LDGYFRKGIRFSKLVEIGALVFLVNGSLAVTSRETLHALMKVGPSTKEKLCERCKDTRRKG